MGSEAGGPLFLNSCLEQKRVLSWLSVQKQNEKMASTADRIEGISVSARRAEGVVTPIIVS